MNAGKENNRQDLIEELDAAIGRLRGTAKSLENSFPVGRPVRSSTRTKVGGDLQRVESISVASHWHLLDTAIPTIERNPTCHGRADGELGEAGYAAIG